MRGHLEQNTRSPRWRPALLAAGILGTAFASWIAWEKYESRHGRAYLAACAQAANAGAFPKDDELRSFAKAFGESDWQHLIREAGRAETKLEGWINSNRNRFPTAVSSLLPPPTPPHARWSALTKAWFLSSEGLDQRRFILLRILKQAQPRTQPLLADLCVTFPRNKPPILTTELLDEIKAVCTDTPELKAYLMSALSWTAEPLAEPAIRAVLEEWTRDPDPRISEGAARTLARRPIAAPATARP
jgi:hypothetical protein